MKKHRKSLDFHDFHYFDVSFAILESRIFPEFTENLKIHEKHEKDEK